jgi:hypothetical protein
VLEQHGNIEVVDALRIGAFEGFYNLSLFLLCFALAYNTLRNVRENGLAIDPIAHLTCQPAVRDAERAALIVAAALSSASATAFCTVFFTVRRRILSPRIAVPISAAFAVAAIAAATVAIWSGPMAPGAAAITIVFVIIALLKAHSYVATNYAIFRRKCETVAADKASPPPATATATAEATPPKPSAAAIAAAARTVTLQHVTLSNFAYFMFCAPTLVYEPVFPRTESVRWRYVIQKLAECGFAVSLQYCLLAQFILPPLSRTSSGNRAVDVLRLALPSIIVWLLGFYSIFHCLMNALAEMARFADRRFYEDWWNTTSLDLFWRKWNRPVHEWCLRHVYVESMVYYRVSKTSATISVFLVSALFHELITSVAFRAVRPWFFFGMLAQIPLIALSRMFRGKRRGNLIVWCSLFLGQPMLELLYIREWFQHHSSFFCVAE